MTRIASLLVIAAAAACSQSNPFKPTDDNISGIYSLQSLTTDSAGTQRNWIDAGASLDIFLTADGHVGGQFVIPPVPPDTLFAIAFMDGTWTRTADTVRFSQSVDTFVRDLAWVASLGRLTADQTFGQTRIKIVLTK